MTDSLTERFQNIRLTVIAVDRARRRLCARGTIKVEPANGRADTIVVLRRAWEEIASPEV